MRTIRCRQFRSVLTSYVDNEVSAGERLIVEAHLRQCDGCRRRVSREGAVRQRLQRWSVEAHEDGAPLSWPEGSGTPTHRRMGTGLRIAALSAAAIAIVFVMWSRWWVAGGVQLTARGQISDSRCAGGHAHASPELRNMSSRDCVQRCVEMGAQYVFVSQGVVYAIRNQDLDDLTRLAGQEVQLEGQMRQHLLTVSHVRPLAISRARTEAIGLRAANLKEFARAHVTARRG